MSQSPEAMKVWHEAFGSGPGCCDGKCPACNSAASVIEAALQKARDEERTAVVAWLRAGPAVVMTQDIFSDFANAIERGEHRREG